MRVCCLLLALSWLPSQAPAQQVAVVKFPYVQSMIDASHDTTYVINFWATWCKPCVRELPEFLAFENETRDRNVKLVLVSLDFLDQLQTTLIPFVTKRKIRSRVVLLDDIDYNAWIDSVSPEWGGGIPATLVVNRKRNLYAFHEGELDAAGLRQLTGIKSRTIEKQEPSSN